MTEKASKEAAGKEVPNKGVEEAKTKTESKKESTTVGTTAQPHLVHQF